MLPLHPPASGPLSSSMVSVLQDTDGPVDLALFSLGAVVLGTAKLPAAPGVPVATVKRLAGLVPDADPGDAARGPNSASKQRLSTKRRRAAVEEVSDDARQWQNADMESHTVLACFSQHIPVPKAGVGDSPNRRPEGNEMLGLKRLVICSLLEKHMFLLLNSLSGVIQSPGERIDCRQRALIVLEV